MVVLSVSSCSGYFMCVCLDHCTFKKQLVERSDYGFHSYSELCQFVYCLLSRSRRLSDIPELNDWDAYMDSTKIATLGKVDSADFLVNHSFGEELRRSNTQELCEFRLRCQEFMDRLVEVILSLLLVSAEFYQGIYSFCPELLLEGVDRYIFGLYAKLLRVLEKSGWLTKDVGAWS